MNLKRFLLFSGMNYYPAGGWEDFKASFDIKGDAMVSGDSFKNEDWFEIVDIQTGEIVYYSKSNKP